MSHWNADLQDELTRRLRECNARHNGLSAEWKAAWRGVYDQPVPTRAMPKEILTGVRVTGSGSAPALLLDAPNGELRLGGEETLLTEQVLHVWTHLPNTNSWMLHLTREQTGGVIVSSVIVHQADWLLVVSQQTRAPIPGKRSWRITDERTVFVPADQNASLTAGMHTVNRWQLTGHLARTNRTSGAP